MINFSLSNNSVATISLTNDTPGGDFHNVAITPDGANVAASLDGNTAFVTDRGNGWVRALQVP